VRIFFPFERGLPTHSLRDSRLFRPFLCPPVRPPFLTRSFPTPPTDELGDLMIETSVHAVPFLPPPWTTVFFRHRLFCFSVTPVTTPPLLRALPRDGHLQTPGPPLFILPPLFFFPELFFFHQRMHRPFSPPVAAFFNPLFGPNQMVPLEGRDSWTAHPVFDQSPFVFCCTPSFPFSCGLRHPPPPRFSSVLALSWSPGAIYPSSLPPPLV